MYIYFLRTNKENKICFLFILTVLSVGFFQEALAQKVQKTDVKIRLGQGFSQKTSKYLKHCLQPCGSKASLAQCYEGQQAWSQTQLYLQLRRRAYLRELQAAALLSVDTKAVQIGLEVQRLRRISRQSLALSYHFVSNYVLGHRILALSQLMPKWSKLFARSPQGFATYCGDSFVQEKVLGGRLYFSLFFRFRSVSEKRRFLLRFSARALFAKVSKFIQKQSHRMDRNTEVRISGFQLGGNPARLRQLFKKNKQSVQRCTFADLKPCREVLRKLQHYARHVFPKAITKRPIALSVRTAPYFILGIVPSEKPSTTKRP